MAKRIGDQTEMAQERLAAARPWLLAMAAPERVAIGQR
jgi:hypothetical protein